jgi:hypothetical protein
MTRIDLVLAILAILLAAMVSGWALHWLWGRLSRHRRGEIDHLHEMAERLHEVEFARDVAERKLAEVELASHTAIAEREAELEGAMDTIGGLRRQLAEWQSAYDALQAAKTGDNGGASPD